MTYQLFSTFNLLTPMPTLWTPPKDSSLYSLSACDYQNPANNALVPINDTAQETVIEKLKKRCKKYKDDVISSAPLPHKDNLIRAANFLVHPDPANPQRASLLGILEQNIKDILFVRVYYGVEENGESAFYG
jgi:hypothetical protein